jgi:hypothetical protein
MDGRADSVRVDPLGLGSRLNVDERGGLGAKNELGDSPPPVGNWLALTVERDPSGLGEFRHRSPVSFVGASEGVMVSALAPLDSPLNGGTRKKSLDRLRRSDE